MQTASTSPILDALRWIAVGPAWAVSAWLAWLVISLGNRLTMALAGYDPDSLLGRFFIEIMSHVALGAGGVYAGARVAPRRKSPTAAVLAAVTIALAGFILYPAIVIEDWWAVLSLAAVGVGAGVLAWSVATGDFVVP